MSKNCKCVGCETQRYYEEARKVETKKSTYSISLYSDSGKVNTLYSKEIELYDFYNLAAEFFGIEIDLDNFSSEEKDSSCCKGCCGL